MATVRNWAILLCKFADAQNDYDVDYYRRLFTAAGSGTRNVVDYFHEASNGQVDISGSQVFDGITLTQSSAQYMGSGVNQAGRQALVDWAKAAAVNDGAPLGSFFGVVILTLPAADVFGSWGQAVLNPDSISVGVAAHEMSHGFGLQHSWSESTGNSDYMDPFDMMSWASTLNPFDPQYGTAGPLLNAVNMRRVGWLDSARVVAVGPGDHEVTIRPLTREDLSGPLAAEIDGYVFEYRPAAGWDTAFPYNGVLVHSLNADRSVLHFGLSGQALLPVGGVFRRGQPWNPYDRRLTATVHSISPEAATLRFSLVPAEPAPQAGPGIVFGGVNVGAGGWVIVNGQPKKVPPRGPITTMLESLSQLAVADEIANQDLRQQVRRYALAQIETAIAEERQQG